MLLRCGLSGGESTLLRAFPEQLHKPTKASHKVTAVLSGKRAHFLHKRRWYRCVLLYSSYGMHDFLGTRFKYKRNTRISYYLQKLQNEAPIPSFTTSTNARVMTRPGRISFVVLSLFFVSVASQANFTKCLETFKANGNATGGTDWSGRPVNDSKRAVALTYETCCSLCGSGQEAFDWSVFSQQFSAWLLPWLALVSQLPFGAESRLDNLISGESLVECADRPVIPIFCRVHY